MDRRGVHTTTSVFSKYASARSSSAGFQPGGVSGQRSPNRDRSLLGSSTIEDTPRSAHSSTSRRISTVLPDPEPAKIAVCLRSAARSTDTGLPPALSRPRVTAVGECSITGAAGWVRIGPVASSASTSIWAGGGGSPAISPRAARSQPIPWAGRRRRSHSGRSGWLSSIRSRSAVMVRTSSSLIGSTRPPAASNSAMITAVLAPLGHAVFRSRNNRRRSGLKPVASQALRILFCTATALPEEIARNAQCRSSSIAASRVWRSRPCSTTRWPGSGSGRNACPASPSSVIHASRAADSRPGIVVSSPSGSSAATVTARCRYSAKRRSSSPVSPGAAPPAEVSCVPVCSAVRLASSSTVSRSRQRRTWVSARLSNWRGVYWVASSNAEGRMGQLGYGAANPIAE
ncbi:hypothetical protein BN975_00130 [Mycolicibacterium farcinogenes]|nr:hypothetical protein BN975_00130 [Mycolicibacterium farcinogenes]